MPPRRSTSKDDTSQDNLMVDKDKEKDKDNLKLDSLVYQEEAGRVSETACSDYVSADSYQMQADDPLTASVDSVPSEPTVVKAKEKRKPDAEPNPECYYDE